MTRETYIKITDTIRNNPKRIQIVTYSNKILTRFVSIFYPLFLLVLFFEKNPFLFRAIAVPAISFVAVSIFRKIVNVPRPYEKFNVAPVLKKDTNGKSFPSRHVFSIFIIATTLFYVYPLVGTLLSVAGIALAILRVIGGVHEPRDVIAGAIVGIVCGWIGYYLI